MFSSRTPLQLTPNRLSRLLASKRAGGARILDLTESNPTRAGLLSGFSAEQILGPLSDPRGLLYEPCPQGAREARSAISRYYAGRGLAVDPERLVLCASTSEAYSWLFQLLCDADERVLYPQPSYPLFEQLAGLCAVLLQPYPLDYDGSWRIDLEALRAGCQPETRAVLLVNPNNPTGSFLRQDELEPLLEICRSHRLALIVDEVFGDYRFSDRPQDSVTSLVELSAESGVLCFVLSGLSKVLGLPQLKLGWIYLTGGPPPLLHHAQERLEFIADTFLSVGTPVQLAAPALLSHQPALSEAIRRRVLPNRHIIEEAVAGTACQVLQADGGWYAVVRLPLLYSEEEWAMLLLREDDVLCHPGYFYDFQEEAYIVVSLLPEAAALREGIERLIRRVEMT